MEPFHLGRSYVYFSAMRAFGNEGPACQWPVSSTGCNVLPIYMEVQQVRLPMVLLAFCLLFAFWTAAFFLHLRGGLTTYSLLVISLTLLIRTRRVTDGA